SHEHLDRLLKPASIAIVGASAAPEKAGYMAVKLLESFAGDVFPVNLKETEILGRRAYPSLAAIGRPVAMVMVLVPAAACPAVVREAAATGAGSVVVIGGGVGEIGAEGEKIQNELVAICRETVIPMLAPNTAGFAAPGQSLVASFSLPYQKL